MKKLKVAFLIHTLGRGGAEQALVNLVNGLDKEKFDVTVFTIIKTGELIDSIDKNVSIKNILPIPDILIKKNTSKTGTLVKGNDKLSIPAKLYAYLWRNCSGLITRVTSYKLKGYDILVSYLEGPANKYLSKVNIDTTKIAWVHVDVDKERKSEIFFRNKKENIDHYKAFDKVVAVSNGVKSSLKEYLGVTDNVVTIYNVYDDKKIIDKSDENISLSDLQYFKDEKINLVSVGRLSKQKGYDRLIEAMKIIKIENNKLYNNINIVIIGDGEEYNRLQVANEETVDAIKFIGFRRNPYKFIKKSDGFISSSVTEGFSTVVVEALLLNKYILSTKCSGMYEILHGYKDSYISQNSIEGIVDLIMHFDKVKGQNLQINGVKSISSKFSKEDTLITHEVFFSKVYNRNN